MRGVIVKNKDNHSNKEKIDNKIDVFLSLFILYVIFSIFKSYPEY